MIRYFWSTVRCFSSLFTSTGRASIFTTDSWNSTTSAMWPPNRLINSIQTIWSQARNRKLLLLVLIILVLLLYIWPSWLKPASTMTFFSTHSAEEPIHQCTKKLFHQHWRALGSLDAVAFHTPLEQGEGYWFPYVGNGKFGISPNSDSALYVRQNRTLATALQFYPIVEVSLSKVSKHTATVVNFLDGQVFKRECFEVKPEQFVVVSYKYFAHRTRSSILVQDIFIENLSDQPVILSTKQVKAAGWLNASSKTLTINQQQFSLTSGTVKAEKAESSVSVATSTVPSHIEVAAKHTATKRVLTAIHYSPQSTKPASDQTIEAVKTDVKDHLTSALNSPDLTREHISAWNLLWQTGFSISRSRAYGFLNGDKINSTMYWCLSQTRAPLHELTSDVATKTRLIKELNYAENCYKGHRTISKAGLDLWRDVDGEDSLNTLVMRWIMLLEKQGCSSMLTAGADGVAQSMTLTFGPLHFYKEHLELAIHPSELHRDHHFRRIQYGKDTHVNISVEVGADNKAKLYVSLDRNDRPYYACDAGCLDDPVKLDKHRQMFPVKLTEPVTPILYITEDEQHIRDLRHGLAIEKHVIEAPAHDDHILQLHKHGHRWGGLPPLFWILLILLVVCFHVLLCRLIYKEYCYDSNPADYGRRYIT